MRTRRDGSLDRRGAERRRRDTVATVRCWTRHRGRLLRHLETNGDEAGGTESVYHVPVTVIIDPPP